MNIFRTGILMAAMTGLFLAAGFLLGGQIGMVIAFLIAVGMNFYSYWNSDKLVLKMYRAREVDGRTSPDLFRMVERLSQNAGLPMPKVYVADNPQPNAFATGRNPAHAAVCATTRLLQRLSSEEVAGVMAHELAHVKNRDTFIINPLSVGKFRGLFTTHPSTEERVRRLSAMAGELGQTPAAGPWS